MTNYQEVIEKYRDVDLYKMSDAEYAELKEAEMADMQSYVDAINNSTEPAVMYKKGRAVTDLKNLIETSAAIWGDKVLYHQIMKGDDHYSEFTYGQVLKDVRGIGTELTAMGLRGEHIGVIGANCYEWAESYFAVTGGVGVVVPLDKELTPAELENLVEMGDIKAVICCQEKYYNIFKEIKAGCKTELKYVIGVGHDDHENADEGLCHGMS